MEPRMLLQGLCFGEGPRFRDGRLYFSDMHAHEVMAVDPGGKHENILEVPNKPSGLGWLPDGRMLVVSMTDRRLLRVESGTAVTHCDLSELATGHCNDMVVDSRGRAYVGNFGFDLWNQATPAATRLLLVDVDGSCRVVADELMFPNGMVIDDAGRTLIVAETFAARLTAFDIEADGSLTNRRLWAQLPAPPDGICLDANDHIWVAVPIAPGGFLRVAEGGEVEARIDVEDHGGFACMLGGENGRTLFLLEARSSDPDAAAPGNARIRSVEVEVPRTGLP